MKGEPETGGWFGREGLKISAVIQFNDKQFTNYISDLNNKAVWKPVPFRYSPATAQEYSELSLSWVNLPISLPCQKYFEGWAYAKEIQKITNGKYYCCLIGYRRGEKVEKEEPGKRYTYSDGAIYRSIIVSVHGLEWEDNRFGPFIRTLGVLDFDAKRLYALIDFSG